jgi:hypothetical protein
MFSQQNPENQGCGKPGQCHNFKGECIFVCEPGSWDYELNTLALAEHLCVEAVALAARSRMKDPFKDVHSDAWFYIEWALAVSPDDPETKEELLAMALKKLDMIADYPEEEIVKEKEGRFPYYIDARLLEIYLPTFINRAYDRETTREQMYEVNQRLANLLEEFDARFSKTLRHPIVVSKRTEIETALIANRTLDPDYFLYPASPREERGRTPTKSKQNPHHDLYVPRGDIKVPVSVTTSQPHRNQGDEGDMVVAIYQVMTNLGTQAPLRHQQEWRPTKRRHVPHETREEDPFELYEQYAPGHMPRYIVWGATGNQTPPEERLDDNYLFVQMLNGNGADSFSKLLIREARGERLGPIESNMLNGATHYLHAWINTVAKNIAEKR